MLQKLEIIKNQKFNNKCRKDNENIVCYGSLELRSAWFQGEIYEVKLVQEMLHKYFKY